MPQFKTKLLGFKLNKAAWSKRFQLDLERLTRNAAREWIRAVVMNIPTWSGMALGSVKLARGANGSLAQFLHVAVPINPVSSTGKTFISPTSGKRVHLDKMKTPEAGGEMASYGFDFSNKKFSFHFTSQVPHFMHNEFFERTDPGAAGQKIEAPWNSMEKGRGAFLTYIHNEVRAKRFARIRKFITRTSVESLVESDEFPSMGSSVRTTYNAQE